jgi:hypothetical protein
MWSGISSRIVSAMLNSYCVAREINLDPRLRGGDDWR